MKTGAASPYPNISKPRSAAKGSPPHERLRDEHMTRRVVVTGMGAINPIGHAVESVWEKLKKGVSGVAYTTIFDVTNFPTRISAEIKNWDIADSGEDPERWKFRGRHTKFAAGAAKQAMAQSGVL